jgi:imidazolonepropionase-like amidohydrolase
MIRFSIALTAIVIAGAAHAQSDSLRIYYVGRPVGWEHYEVKSRGDSASVVSDFSYVDRGRRIHLQSTMSLGADYSPRHLEVARLTDTSRTVQIRVDVDGRTATVTRGTQASNVALPAFSFALSAYEPISQHLALLRYWQAHGRPTEIDIVPGGPTNRVTVRLAGVTRILLGARTETLTRYAIDGVVWGREYAWLDGSGKLAMFASAAGGLSTKAIAAGLVPAEQKLIEMAADAAIRDLVSFTPSETVLASGTIALVGATLVDGSGKPAVSDAAVVVRDGRIIAAGPRASVTIPRDAKQIDVRGKTLVPGLWDMHAHLHQAEWIPVYLAAGVTTVRDMGNELPFITDLRRAVETGKTPGPRVVLAGLIDGDGPNAFGAMSASTPDEGRAIVRRYHELGFEQMKLYSLLSPAVVGAVCDEAHKLGMTVTGHIPNSLSLVAAVDSGMDHVAHLPLRGDAQSDTVRKQIAHLKAKGTVVDPTASWGEIGGHSSAEPLESFQPVTAHLPAVFLQSRASGWGTTADTATAHARLARTLSLIGALHEAGVPIVAGTDEGVPGFSVYREMELYVRAGFTPMDALRAATAVPSAAMHMERDVGTIEPGKRADLLVLDANPLENISNIRRVRSVMANGVLYDPTPLWRAGGFIP